MMMMMMVMMMMIKKVWSGLHGMFKFIENA